MDVGRFKFANRVCEELNGLDDDVAEVGSVNAFNRKLARSSLEECEGVFLSTCFFPQMMVIHGDLLLEAWMDPGNPRQRDRSPLLTFLRWEKLS